METGERPINRIDCRLRKRTKIETRARSIRGIAMLLPGYLTLIVSLLVQPYTVFAAEKDDSLTWSVVYRNRARIEKASAPFSWNDSESESHLEDSAVLMVWSRIPERLDIFLKGSTGFRGEKGADSPNRFYLKQGHAEFRFLRDRLRLKAFLRERVFYSNMRLLKILSNDGPYLKRNAEGIEFEASLGGLGHIKYIGARFSDDVPEYSDGGLPWIEGNTASINFIQASIAYRDRGHLALSVTERKPLEETDAVTLSIGGGVYLSGIRFLAEFSEEVDEDLKGLGQGDIRGIDWDRIGIGDLSAALPVNSAFSSEVLGVSWRDSTLGRVSLIPGYRYFGSGFSNREGEIDDALAESYIRATWRHLDREAMISLKAADIYIQDNGERYKYLAGRIRARLKEGFEIEGSLLAREAKRPSFVITLYDDSEFGRLSTTARIDDPSGDNKFTFLSEGSVNLFEAWTLRSTLLFNRSVESRYSISLEYRSSDKYLFAVSSGSFDPNSDFVAIDESWGMGTVRKNRQIRIYTRVWLGEIGGI